MDRLQYSETTREELDQLLAEPLPGYAPESTSRRVVEQDLAALRNAATILGV